MYKTDFPVMSNDMLPTACDIVNVSMPSDRLIDGVSIFPLIKRESDKRNSSMKWAYLKKGDFDDGPYEAAISHDQYKVHAIYNYNKVTSELYDLKNDPCEKQNIKKDVP